MFCEASPLAIFLFDQGIEHSRFCREESCLRNDLHLWEPSCFFRRALGRATKYGTRSKRHAKAPWHAPSQPALRESVLSSVSKVEPRNFTAILRLVENDYGSCCERSVHRQLRVLRCFGKIVRLDFPGRVHAYLKAGARLINDPDLVYEQIIDLKMAEAA